MLTAPRRSRFGKLFELTDRTIKVEIHDILANDEHAVALVTISASRNVKNFLGAIVAVFHVRDGKASESQENPTDRYEVDPAPTGARSR